MLEKKDKIYELKLRRKSIYLLRKNKLIADDDDGNPITEEWMMSQPIEKVIQFIEEWFNYEKEKLV